MRALIIEDEKPSARRLQRMLSGLEVTIGTLLHSVEDSVEWFQGNAHPDLIFLDIQLSDGLCFEIFDLVKVESAIIFTTAYDEYALQAFKLNSIDYLLKPIDEDELRTAVEKYKDLNHKDAPPAQTYFEDIKKLLVNPVDREYKKRFTTKVGQHIKIIAVDEIECFYSEHKGTYAYTRDGHNYLLDNTLEKVVGEVSPENFFRVNRTFLVNINAIKDIVSYTNSRLQLKLYRFKEHDIIVAREKVKDFKLWIE